MTGAERDATPRGKSTKVLVAAVRVRDACAEHAVDHESLRAQFAGNAELAAASDFVFGASTEVPTMAVMRSLVRKVERVLDLAEPLPVNLVGLGQRMLRSARAVFAALVLGLSGWVVIGSIVLSENDLAHETSPLFAMAVLMLALVMLALLEAAHIGAVALSNADVSSLETSHARVFRLHRHIDTKPRLEHYLAARQVGVVLVVFMISELTRTAGISTLPGTTVAIPSALEFLFHVGVPGAILVLVIGQVMPQIVTARRPAEMMNFAPMAAAFHFTRAIGALGLALPASWLVAWVRPGDRIASASRERYVSTTVDVNGFGVLGIARTVVVGTDTTHVTSETTAKITQNGCTVLPLDITTAFELPTRMRVSSELLGDVADSMIVSTQVVDERLADGSLLLSSDFAPRLGAFDEGDVLSVTSQLDFAHCLTEDFVLITTPTKLVTLRVVLEVAPIPLPPAELTLTRQSDGEVYRHEWVEPRTRADGSIEFSASAFYPDPGTVLRMKWAPVWAVASIGSGARMPLGVTS